MTQGRSLQNGMTSFIKLLRRLADKPNLGTASTCLLTTTNTHTQTPSDLQLIGTMVAAQHGGMKGHLESRSFFSLGSKHCSVFQAGSKQKTQCIHIMDGNDLSFTIVKDMKATACIRMHPFFSGSGYLAGAIDVDVWLFPPLNWHLRELAVCQVFFLFLEICGYNGRGNIASHALNVFL